MTNHFTPRKKRRCLMPLPNDDLANESMIPIKSHQNHSDEVTMVRGTGHRSFMRLLSAILLLCVATSSAFAQDEEDRPVLPDIAPRTVEIRGQLEIHFPALERQPLSGFNPPPRMVDMTSRLPYTETYRTGAADLPASPLQAPTAPLLARLEGVDQRMGLLEARTGRYLARYLDARIEHGFNSSTAITGRLRYRGLDGHEPYDFDPDASSASDDIDGRVDLHLYGENLRGGVGIEGYHASYEMFGATSSFTSPPLIPYPARTGSNLEASGWIRTTTTGPFDGALRARLTGTSFSTDACPNETLVLGRCDINQFERNQRTLSIDGAGTFDIGGQSATAKATVSMSAIDRQTLVGTDLVSADAGVSVLAFQTPTVSLRAGGNLLYTEARNIAGESDYTLLYLSPDIRVDLYPGTGLQLFVENRPSVRHGTLADLYRSNPYVVSTPSVQSDLTTVDARAGARMFRGPATLNVEGGVMISPQYRYFTRSQSDGYASGVSDASYDEVRILHVGGDLAVVVGGVATANAGLTWRHGRLTSRDVAIPNFGAFTGRAMLSVPLASNQVVLTAMGRYESARYRDIEQTRQLGDYVAVDLRGTYRVNHMIGIVAAVENISAGYLELWDGYPQPPVVFSGGLRISW